MSAARHWAALDRVFSRVLSPPQAAHAHERVGRRVAALTDIYLPRLASMLRHPAGERSDLTREVRELEGTHRALAAALAPRGGEDVAPAGRDETRYKTAVDVPLADRAQRL